MKKYIFALMFGVLLLGNVHNVYAVTFNDSYTYDVSKQEGPAFYWTGTFSYTGYFKFFFTKTVNLISESKANMQQNFNLAIGKSTTLDTKSTTGKWSSLVGAFKDHSWPFDDYSLKGSINNYLMDNIRHSYTSSGFLKLSLPEDSRQPLLTSSNPAVVECKDLACKALSAGTAKITVSFPKKEYTHKIECWLKGQTCNTDQALFKNEGLMGNANAYGKVTMVDMLDSGTDTIQKLTSWQTYSFASYVYTVTVPAIANDPPVVTWNNPTSITDTSAIVNWNYVDKENDPQKAYQIQISTDSQFSSASIVKNISNVSSANTFSVTGLIANTQYYGRVRAMNAVNTDWTAWSSGSFKTTNAIVPPCDPAVSVCPPPCNPTTQTCPPCDPSTSTCGNTGGSSLSCSVTPNPATLNQNVTYRASDTSGNSYKWFTDSNKTNQITGQSSAVYTTSFSSTTSYTRTVEMNKAGTLSTAICPVLTVGCGTRPSDGICSPGDTTHIVYGSCQTDGTYSQSTQSCTGISVLPSATFSFNPNIVAVGSSCKLYLEATNSATCTLTSRSGTSIPFTADADGLISITGEQSVPVGTYTLSCAGSDGISKSFGAKSCLSTPSIKEN